MKHTRLLRTAWLVVILLLTATLVGTASGQEIAFTESFDDPGLSGWERPPNVEVVDGVLHVDVGGYASYGGEWGDLNLTVRARRLGEGSIVVRYRITEVGDYAIHISGDQISLNKAGEAIAQETIEPIPPEEWFVVEVIAAGESHQILLNGQPALMASDPDPLPPGGIALSVQGEAKGEFDDLVVVSLGEAPPPEEPGPAETAPPEEPASPGETGEVPTEGPSVSAEGVPAYQSEPWVVLGGPPGGLGYDIRMVPENPDIMYVTDSGGGIFKSIDGGQSWVPINQGIERFPDIGTRIFCATIDPHDSNTIWIGTQMSARIYRSTDGGQTWQELDNGIIPTDTEHSVRGITIDPNDPNVVYAGLEDTTTTEGIARSHGEVYKSTDAGLNWTRIWSGENLARYVWVDPRNTQRLFVSTGIFDRTAANAAPDFEQTPVDARPGKAGGVGVLRSEDGGQTWTVLNEKNGLDGGLYIPSLFMHPQNPDLLIAAVSAHQGIGAVPGVYMTQDGGDTWKLIQHAAENTGAEVSMEAVEISVSNPNIWYAAASEVIHRSDDGGQTWKHFPLRTVDRRSGFPIDIQVDPRDPNRLFVNGYAGGNMMSTDGGETWVDASGGYSGAGIWGVIVDPENSLTVTVSANTANFRSTDGGHTWRGVELGRFDEHQVWEFRGRIVSHPEGSGIHIMGSAAINKGYVFHSTDGGSNWEASKVVDITEMFENGKLEYSLYVARALAFAPSDPQTVYIGYGERYCLLGGFTECWKTPPGFFRSHDGGYTWEYVENTPFKEASILTLAVSLDDPRTLYVATMVGVFRSQDGGDTWQNLENLESITPLSPGEGLPPIFVIATDPFDSGTVYAGSPRGGVFRSEDSGNSWEQAGYGMDPNEAINDLLPDPHRPGVIYASTRESGVYYTTNGGESWSRLSEGISEMWVDQLALSDDGSVLYAGTHVSGVIRLGTPIGTPPEEPAPTATEPFEAQPTARPEEVAEPSGTGGICPLGAALPAGLLGLVWVSYRKR